MVLGFNAADAESGKFEESNNANKVRIRTLITQNNSEVSDSNPLPVLDYGQLVPKIYDYIALTYVASGNGVGQIETVTYKTGGVSGTTVAVLTLTYNASNNIETVTRA